MDVVGVICEYDPFHRGHKRQFELIRQRLPGAAILCLMSGCFTQRGAPALYSPAFRAGRALLAGADIVLELPAAFAVREAENFALGGVSLLTDLRFVTHLSFGAEDELSALAPIAGELNRPGERFTETLKKELDAGASFAAAQGKALEERLPGSGAIAGKPNNILALCYLRALDRLQSPLAPLPVLREGDYHARSLESGAWPSATAVRRAALAGNEGAVWEACGYAPPRSPICPPNALDSVTLYRLRSMALEQLAALPGCGEGLENRLWRAARAAVSREELLSRLKTRRYPYTRLSRLCCHGLLGVTGELLSRFPLPPYARLLGFGKESEGLLRLFRQSKIPIVAKAADGDREHPLYQLDERAYDLWALGAGLPAGYMARANVTIVSATSGARA